MSSEIKQFDRQGTPFFGRKTELSFLLRRTQRPGITIIVGKSKIGKSWIVNELCRELLKNDNTFIGYAESTGQQNLILEVLIDLYLRWYSNSSYFEQAKLLYNNIKKDKIKTLTSPVLGVLNIIFEPIKPFRKCLNEAISYLKDLNTELETGAIGIPRLPYQRCLELVQALDHITTDSSRFIFVLDAWERTPNPKPDVGFFEKYLNNINQWPNTHFFVIIQDALMYDEHKTLMKNVVLKNSGVAHLLEIGLLELNDSENEGLLNYLKKEIVIDISISDDEILKFIGGYPGTIDRLITFFEYEKTKLEIKDLQVIKKEALACYYFELDSLLSDKIDDNENKFLIWLILLPPVINQEIWQHYKKLFINHEILGDHEYLSKQLKAKNILKKEYPWPSLGHSSRHEATKNWIIKNRILFIQEELDNFIITIANLINGYKEEYHIYIYALSQVDSIFKEIGYESEFKYLPLAAKSLHWGLDHKELVPFWETLNEMALKNPKVTSICAMAMVNAQKSSERPTKGLLLESLYNLLNKFPENKTLVMTYAKGLYNVLDEYIDIANEEGINNIINKLNELFRQNDTDQTVALILIFALKRCLSELKGPRQEKFFLDKFIYNLNHPTAYNALIDFKRSNPESKMIDEFLASSLLGTFFDVDQFIKGYIQQKLPYDDPEYVAKLKFFKSISNSTSLTFEGYCRTICSLLHASIQKEKFNHCKELLEEIQTIPIDKLDNDRIRHIYCHYAKLGLELSVMKKVNIDLLSLFNKLYNLAKQFPDDKKINSYYRDCQKLIFDFCK